MNGLNSEAPGLAHPESRLQVVGGGVQQQREEFGAVPVSVERDEASVVRLAQVPAVFVQCIQVL